MSKILKLVVCSVYSALIFHIIITFFQSEEMIEIKYVFRTPGALKKIQREIKKNRSNVNMINKSLAMHFKRPERLPTDLKYILKWTEAFSHYNSMAFKSGQRTFIINNCTHYNCYMTNDKSLLTDPRYFNAILFDVENNWDDHPSLRIPHQKYIFTASESSSNYPICHPLYDSYYNWTWSYKLDSNIRSTYFNILDKNDLIVGPKINMTWVKPMKPISNVIKEKLKDKKKAAAWFVSNCESKSGREKIANDLIQALSQFNLSIDIYGWCGKLKCPRDRIEECLQLLQKKYYFYLAFENSLSEDYVTEKVLHAMLHYTVPIVYGGADYSRFLAPNSYINAGELSPDTVASLMFKAMRNPEIYHSYFKWHNHYTYKETSEVADVCTLCKLLQTSGHKVSTVKNFRRWWNPKYEVSCKDYKENNETKLDFKKF